MAGIILGNDFNAELVAFAGCTPEQVDPSTVAYLNPGGDTTVRVTATANVDTDALSALIRKYTPLPRPTATGAPRTLRRRDHRRPRPHRPPPTVDRPSSHPTPGHRRRDRTGHGRLHRA